VAEQKSAIPQNHISHGLLFINRKEDYPVGQDLDPLQLDIKYTHNIPAPTTQPFWIQKNTPPGSSTIYTLYREQTGWRLDIKCQGSGTFLYSEKGIKVYWLPEGTDATHYLFGIGLALWFELQGIPCIHGNSLAAENQAIALLGASQAGKSTLTAALLQKGFSFLTDDLVVPRQTDEGWQIHPAPSPLRMWPNSIKHFLPGINIASLNQVHTSIKKRLVPIEATGLGKICQKHKPLKQIYLLDRDCTEKTKSVYINALRPADALVALIANSISGGILRPLGIEQSRLDVLTQLIKEVPVKRIRYPNGYQHLDEVKNSIVADLF